MKRIRYITVVQALIRRDTGSYKSKSRKIFKANTLSVERNRILPVNLLLGIRELVIHSKAWFLLLAVNALAVCIMIIPANLYNTFRSPEFATYMGTAISDIRIDLQFVKDLNRKHEEIVKRLASDKDVHRFKVYAHCLYEVLGEEGWQDMQIEFGDYSDFIVAYLEGRGPEREGEIAVSTMNAKKYSVGVGDTLKLRITGEEKVYSVCGIYQDVTNGGFTAKTVYPYEPEDVVKYTYFIDTEDGIFPDAKASELAKELSFAKVIPMEEYLAQTFDMVIDPLSQAAIAVKVVAVFITLLITVLFLKLNTAREYSQIANMKAMGFSLWDIRMQYMLKTGIAAVMGILAGILISNTLGESMVSALISAAGFGLSMIDFAIRPMEIYLLYPSMVIIAAVSAAWLCSAAVKKYNIVGMIQE